MFGPAPLSASSSIKALVLAYRPSNGLAWRRQTRSATCVSLGDSARALTQTSGAGAVRKSRSAHAGNVSEAIRKHGIANIQQCRFVISVATIGQPEPGRPGSRRASAGTTRRFQPVLTHRSLEDASHEPSRGLTVVVVSDARPASKATRFDGSRSPARRR